MNILIVEDEKNFAHDLKEEIEDYRFRGKAPTVMIANSGWEALNLLGKMDFAVMIIDIIMETPDAGLQIVEFIREQQRNNLIQIIVMTARPDIYEESDIIAHYDIHSFIDKPLGLKRQHMLVISALRSYYNLIENIRLTEEAAINQRRIDILEKSSLRDLTTELSSIRQFAEIIFQVFVQEPEISSAALYEEHKLLQHYPKNADEEFYHNLYLKFQKEKKQLIDDYVFIKVREFPDFVFIAGADSIARKQASQIMSIGIITRQILINIISDRKRIKPLAQLSELIDDYDYIKAFGGYKIKVHKGMEETEIDLSFGALFLFFGDEKIFKVSRSLAVNPQKAKIAKFTSRDVRILTDIEEFPVARSRIKEALERFQE